ncbi:MAG TPA: 16S rRNA (guanine(527)-N(7))-methyltransferase RsmG [Bacteroidia bacterium]|nr:16S rRNA (guanine(527)-N(7))-methyltransferase RsmG [Bacteroidia bacterium]
MSIILKYFPNITATQQEQFSKLQSLYEEWNAQINVISRKDIDLLYERHVLHSLGIAKVIQFNPKTNVMDVGCGGGFPGIPLAILFPECNFYLVDSIGKKIKVVNEIAQALGLKNVRAEHKRAEEVKEKFEFIVSRAVTEFPTFYRWVQNKIDLIHRKKNHLLCFKKFFLKIIMQVVISDTFFKILHLFFQIATF